MSSVIEGYNYDIFISYRHKDNKYDGWVSEFVDNLKKELEATFKEDISVYFDENPHDRLQETHNVDKSLEGKLKCLIFIPILSQTYCDPSSYAWQYEFLLFLEILKSDRFGKDIRLRNGNVTSRILPVRIHDLEQEDIDLFEKETASVLRSLDFVFKTTSGVIRPLLSNEDHPQDNLNKTFYRDQISKLALAIKELLFGMKAGPAATVAEKTRLKEQEEKESIRAKGMEMARRIITSKSWLFSFSTLIVILIFIAIFTYPGIFRNDRLKNIRDERGRISVAVIPFENQTGDKTLSWLERGISSLIINGLGGSSELIVFDDHTMYEVIESVGEINTAGITSSVAKEIANKSNAETYISGSFQGKDDKYWIMLNLSNTRSGDIIWTTKVEGNLNSSEYLSMAHQLCKEIKDFLEIKVLKDQADHDFRGAYSQSAEAYRYFIDGMNMILTGNYLPAVESLKKALKIDSTFTMASFYIAYAYCFATPGQMKQAKIWTERAYKTKEYLPIDYQNWVSLWYACYISKNLQEIIQYCNLLEGSNIRSRLFWFDLGVSYCSLLKQYDKAVNAFRQIENINIERNSTWLYKDYYIWFGQALHYTGEHDREKEIFQQALRLFSDNSYNRKILFNQSVCALSQDDTIEAGKYLERYISIDRATGQSIAYVEADLGEIYYNANKVTEAEKHFRRAFHIDPQNVRCIFLLGSILIQENLDVDEGMKLIYNILERYPNWSPGLKIKGLGLFKMGKYAESLEILRRAKNLTNTFRLDINQYIQEAEQAIATRLKE